jgi:6-pyruvoyltetrahydropterin/6-carboxytetrahydropterin synthase
MILWCGDPITPHLIIKFNDPFDLDSMQIVSVPFNPTAENIAEYLVEVVGPNQLKKTGCVLVECKVEETRKCSATYILDAWKQNEECTMLGKFYNASESFMPDPPTGNAEPFDLPF